MAFNKQTFKTRSTTAFVFVLIMLAGLLLGPWSFFLLFTVIHFGCWTEYQRLLGLIDKQYREISPFHKYGFMIVGWCFLLWFSLDDLHLLGIRLHEWGWWIGLVFILLLPIFELLFADNIRLKNIGYSLLGLLYISLCWGLMMDLYGLPAANHGLTHESNIHRVFIPLIIIGCMWVNDTMAYIIGSLIGRTPLSKISPKKTWEGTIGGMITGAAIMGYLGFIFDDWYVVENKFMFWFLLSLVAVTAGTLGDLLESKIKRSAGVKDSGAIMPGHGGFLDRFDSLLLATPFVWIFVRLFMN